METQKPDEPNNLVEKKMLEELHYLISRITRKAQKWKECSRYIRTHKYIK